MPPIATSNSCSTLVDIDENHKLLSAPPPLTLDCGAPYEEEFIETHLLLRAQKDSAHDCDDRDECGSWFKSSGALSTDARQQRLCIPSASASVPLDRHLSTIPSIVERAEELQSHPIRVLSSRTTPDLKIVNVLQGEIGHATARQADIIVSDKATTCHILAVRSTSIRGDREALVSLCHIDKAGYEDCLRDMIVLHKTHHNESFTAAYEEEKKECDDVSGNKIHMELHILGGFSDPNNSSLSITEHLIDQFCRLAEEEKEWVGFTLTTCAVSCLNDDGFGSPIGRGLAMDMHSGEVFLAVVDKSVVGPATDLRSARLWAGASRQRLNIVHSQFRNNITVEPFRFSAFSDLSAILSLPDEVILQYTSTSPDIEDNDFCSNVRSTLRFIRDNNAEDVFGTNFSTVVQYQRSEANEWIAQ